jgi:hypothetical protein
LKVEDIQLYVKAYWSEMPDKVPDEYSMPLGQPYETLVDSETYKRISDSPHGVRDYSRDLPTRQ